MKNQRDNEKVLRYYLPVILFVFTMFFWGSSKKGTVLAASAEVLETTSSAIASTDSTTVQENQKPDPVAGLKASAYSYRKIRLTWNLSAYADGYYIYRSETKTGGYVLVGKAGPASNRFMDRTVVTGKLYYYRVRVVKNGIKSAAMRISCKTKPQKVKGLGTSLTSKNKARLTWTAVPNAQQYVVYRSLTQTGGYKKIKTISSGKTYYTNASVKPGITYYYRVRAVSNGTAGKVSKSSSISIPDGNKIVIVFDPGHGGWDSGACYFGYKEEDLNLEIAKYAKEELEKYQNVSVYLTRTTDWTFCNEDKAKDFKLRAEFAKSKNANAFISIHLNASENQSANGAEIYASVNQKFYTQGEVLGNLILNQLSKLGIAKREVVHRMSGTNPGQDYYGIVRNGVANDMLSMIIEHCFISSPLDISKVLSTTAGRRKLGQADATAIAEYYKLSK